MDKEIVSEQLIIAGNLVMQMNEGDLLADAIFEAIARAYCEVNSLPFDDSSRGALSISVLRFVDAIAGV